MSSGHCNKTNFERQYTDLSYSAAERIRQCLTLHVTYMCTGSRPSRKLRVKQNEIKMMLHCQGQA